MKYIKFQDKKGTFTIQSPENYSGLYFPLAGDGGLKSSITPNLGGDSKTDQNLCKIWSSVRNHFFW